MVKVRMLATTRGANDGHTVTDYVEGEVYEVSRDLAHCFLHDEVAEELETDAPETVTASVAKSKKNITLPGLK